MKGFIVIEVAEDFEQPLGLETGKNLPDGGLLTWTKGHRAIFPDRKSARKAITRTDHYRQAFDSIKYPEAKFCKIVPVVMIGGKGQVKALSIRQPWAWLIVNGHKDIENRCWKTHFRGKIYVHAAKGMTRSDYLACEICCADIPGADLPPFETLERGGIVGTVEIVDCVDQDASPWFFGEFGFVLKNPAPLPFRPLKGALGFFNVEGGEE